MKTIKYRLKENIQYKSERYLKTVSLLKGYGSDGATGAIDLIGRIKVEDVRDNHIFFTSLSFWIHDYLCEFGCFDDGTKCTNWQASQILSDILYSEGYYWRSKYWFWATFLFGGGKCRENGMFKLKNKDIKQ